jgi:hypothetical protein
MRKPTPPVIEQEVLRLCRRRCCLCYGLSNDLTVKQGQIAHLDRNPANFELGNLAFLCLFHHDQYDTRTSQSKRLTESEGRYFRQTLHDLIARDPDSIAPFSRDGIGPEIYVHVGDPPKSESAQPKESNLVLKRWYSGGLFFVGDVWSRNEARAIRHPRLYRAIYVEVKNDSKEGVAVGPALGIKAELIIVGSAGEEEFVPLPWLEEVYNTVNLKFGDVKSVLLAVNVAQPEGGASPRIASISAAPQWCVPLNNRGFPDLTPGLQQMDFNRLLYQGSEKKARLNLLQIKTGIILQIFHGGYRWKDDIFEPEIFF